MLLQLSKTVKQSPKSPQIFENNGTFCADRPFSKNRSETNCQKSFVFNQLVSELQSYILSTTTETNVSDYTATHNIASIVHPFNNNWNRVTTVVFKIHGSFNRTSFQQQLKQNAIYLGLCYRMLQSYILSTTTETCRLASIRDSVNSFNRTSFQQQLTPERVVALWRPWLELQ